jgi:hypothetical protein
MELTYAMGPLYDYAKNTKIIHCPGDIRSSATSFANFAFDSYAGEAYLNGDFKDTSAGWAAEAPFVIYKTTQMMHFSDTFLWLEEADPPQSAQNSKGNGTISPYGFVEDKGSFVMYIGSTSPSPPPPDFSQATWLAYPAINHGYVSTFSYADGHCGAHKWLNPNAGWAIWNPQPSATGPDPSWAAQYFRSTQDP